MFNFLKAPSRCFVYVPVCLQARELLSLTSAAGFELQTNTFALWMTVDGESRDIFISPGERFRIGAHRRVLISADHAVTVTISGEANRTTSIEVIRANGEHEPAYPPRTALLLDQAPIWMPNPVARRVRRPGIVAPLTPALHGSMAR